ncbi:hypothetical protein M9H77_20389 [Catharanthus roseus]|uniref:Uncharacterized protein n=1 Tax=Catharanthus roseus TaxID=4058 RepID=A0ACC0ANK8_CATRO|nr:hypothetical protein M9H77_20389 [Catharanthus roseus]
MVRPSGRKGDANLGPVTVMTGRVEGRPVTASSRGEAGSSTQPPAVPFRSRPPLYPHLSHTPMPYEPYGSAHSLSHHTDTMLGTARQDSSCSTHGYSHAEYGVSSSDHYVPGPAYRFARSRNKRPDVFRDVPAPTEKRKKVKPSDWEQTEAAERGPDRSLLKCRSRYMALTGWELTDSQAGPLDLGLGLTKGLGFNALELHIVATSRQTSQSHQTMYSCPPHPTSGGTLTAEQQDVCLEEHFRGGTLARGTFALTDRDMD